MTYADRTNDTEFLNVLRSSGRSELTHEAKTLFYELFQRVRELERPPMADRLALLNDIAQGMQNDLELLGDKPDKVELRDRVYDVTAAVRDLANLLLHEARQS